MTEHNFGFHTTAEEVTAGLDLTGTSWVVTGCNSGLGMETLRVLTLRGGHVFGLARTLDKAQAAFESLDIAGTPVACELTNLDSVRAAVRDIIAAGRPLDGIIANAGIMALPTLQQQQGIELQFYTNHVGHMALVTGLTDSLTPTGRVVMLSSGAHHMAGPEGIEFDNLSGQRDYHPWRMYGQSKLANILFARSLAKRFASAGSRKTANALHPGVIMTNLARHLPDPAKTFGKLRTKTIPEGAATQCYVATHPDLANVSGAYFSDCQLSSTSKPATDDELAERLWVETENLLT